MVETLLFHVDRPEYVDPLFYRLALRSGEQDQKQGLRRSEFRKNYKKATIVNLIPYSVLGYYLQLTPGGAHKAFIRTKSGEIEFLEDKSTLSVLGKWWGPETTDPLGISSTATQSTIPDDTLRRRAALAGAVRIAVETLEPKSRRKNIVITF